MTQHSPDIAVILPCYNEEPAVADVISKFRQVLPSARIYVYDNASTDNTASVAKKAGAMVRTETMKGKGNAVRRAFADIDADIYVMADGDGTYDAAAAPALIDTMLRETLDMVVGIRSASGAHSFRRGHRLGNKAFSFLFRRLFRFEFTDILSGYRVMSRRFVKSFPSVSKGFEIELEISTHAALLRAPVREMETGYGARIDGDGSKLNTWLDGARILRRMLTFLRLHRPMLVFGLISMLGAIAAILIAAPVIAHYLETGLVPRLPTAILATSIMLAAIMMFVVGVVLDAQARYFSETKRLSYLRIPPPPTAGRRVNPAVVIRKALIAAILVPVLAAIFMGAVTAAFSLPNEPIIQNILKRPGLINRQARRQWPRYRRRHRMYWPQRGPLFVRRRAGDCHWTCNQVREPFRM